jgi:hypothetical protein
MFSRNKLLYNSNLIDFKDAQSTTKDGSGKKPKKTTISFWLLFF